MACRCRGTCVCRVTGGDNTTVTGAGTSTDPYVVSADVAGALELGCGLAGDGSAGDPLSAVAAAGEQQWPWTCDDTESTLHCDPATGRLWTPPEHAAWSDAAPPFEHFPSGWGPHGPGTHVGPAGLQIGLGFVFAPETNVCRQWAGNALISAFVDVTYTADAQFRLGYNVENPMGSAVEFVPMTGILDTTSAGREVFTGSFTRASFTQPPGAIHDVRYAPVVEVLAGQVLVNSWISERSRQFATVSTPT